MTLNQIASSNQTAVTVGTTSDAAVSSDTTGTLSGKIRGLVKILADIWDSTNHRLKTDMGPGADITLIASGPFTTTQTTADQTNLSGRGVRVVLDMTNVGTGSVTLAIEAKDAASGKYVALLTGAAVTTDSTNVYVVYPGLTPSANAIASDVVPRTWRVKVTANNANSATYSVGASMLT